MSSINVKHKPFSKSIEVPTSKSYANRLLILGALSTNSFSIENLPLSTDVETMISCLKKIGLIIKQEQNSLEILNSFPECEPSSNELVIETGDGGTTNRFLLAMLSLGKRPYKMILKGDMRNRPMKEMEDILTQAHCKISNNKGDISIQGPIHYKGVIKVDCSKSTQFITAFKMIESKCPALLKFSEEKLQTSQSYYKMTLSLIEQCKTKFDFKIPIDFSSLSYPLAAGLTLGDGHVRNCQGRDLLQADSIFLDIIKEMNGHIIQKEDGLFVSKKNSLKGITLDCGGFPDLVPTLAYICSYSQGTSILKNLEVLTFKESNRFEEIKLLLNLFEISFKEKNDSLIIHGIEKRCETKEYAPPPDHRMVMIGYLFMRKNRGGLLHSTQHIKKSYGNFLAQMD